MKDLNETAELLEGAIENLNALIKSEGYSKLADVFSEIDRLGLAVSETEPYLQNLYDGDMEILEGEYVLVVHLKKMP